MKYLKSNHFSLEHGNSTDYFEVDDAQNVDYYRAELLMRHNVTSASRQVKIYGVIQRQVRVLGTQMYWATWHTEKDDNYPITDQPEIHWEDLRSDNYVEIDDSEFEDIWNQSLIE
jgi:hypothetical protein